MPSEHSGGKSEGLLTLIYELLDSVHMRGENKHDTAVSMETSHHRAIVFVVLKTKRVSISAIGSLWNFNLIY